jgi:hypothetical protein
MSASLIPAFEGHPLLLLVLGLAALPLLGRRLQFQTVLRSGWALPLAATALGLVAWGLGMLPAAWQGGAAGLPFSLLTGLAVLAGLGRLARGKDRETLELAASVPTLLYLPLATAGWGWNQGPLPEVAGALAAAVMLLLLQILLAGAQEKFRRNRAPGSMEGLPFRLAMVGIFLLLLTAAVALKDGNLP